MKIALVSANFGGVDRLFALPSHTGIDCFYYTDAKFADHPIKKTWNQVIETCLYPRIDFHPRLRSKYFKCQIHRLDEVTTYDYLVWADGAFEFKTMEFIPKFVRTLSKKPENQRAIFVPHPAPGQTILKEYNSLIQSMEDGNHYLTARYANERLQDQVEYFRSKNYNMNLSVYCGGFFILENSKIYHDMLNDWWDHNLRFGIMDQLSLPIALAKNNITVTPMPVHMYKNEFWTVMKHAKIQ